MQKWSGAALRGARVEVRVCWIQLSSSLSDHKGRVLVCFVFVLVDDDKDESDDNETERHSEKG
jgi:hypothetical protein